MSDGGIWSKSTLKYFTSVPVLKHVTAGVDFGRKDFVYFLQIAYVRTSRKKGDEHNILMYPFYILGLAVVKGGSQFSFMHASLVTSSFIRENT
uniref:Uncharacterized protein n=1 Tax=Solanum lycopersicum TaxID=4081 RepID=K4D7L7_SOLLC